jgi:hypothetical protein
MVLVVMMLMSVSAMAGWDVQMTPDGNGGMQAGLAFRVQFDQEGVPADLDLEKAPVTVNSVGPSTNVTDQAGWWAQNWVWVAAPVAAAGGYMLVASNNDYWPYKKEETKATETAPVTPEKPTQEGQNNIIVETGDVNGDIIITINNGLVLK